MQLIIPAVENHSGKNVGEPEDGSKSTGIVDTSANAKSTPPSTTIAEHNKDSNEGSTKNDEAKKNFNADAERKKLKAELLAQENAIRDLGEKYAKLGRRSR